MPSKKDKTLILPDRYYHIFNRGNNFENVFKKEKDYFLFLGLLRKHLCPITQICNYALLPNHFHILLKTNEDLYKNQFSKEYSKLICYYTLVINKRESRSGSLFLNPFKRIRIENDDYLKRLIFYIHFNPQNHKIVRRYQSYKFSSYRAYTYDCETAVNTKEVIDIFGSMGNFYDYHDYFEELDKLKKYSLED
tara:strand:+ start:517 stop:1095 length:579 start_codon:yes stop_codon:yes gene_type:complete